MRLIYLSPHLDDAALSAGGYLFETARGATPVEIWTLMCGVPPGDELSDFARGMHAKWGTTSADQTVMLRRQEDRLAAALIGAKALHFEFLDAIYRRGSDGTWLYGEPVGAAMHPADAELPAQIAEAIRSALEPEDELICQLAIGQHIDHVIVRLAAEQLARPLLYTADLPYALVHPEAIGPATADLQSTLHTVSEPAAGVWLEAVQAYTSQLSTLYESWEQLRADLWALWSAERGIRLWSGDPWSAPAGLDSGRHS